MPSQYGGEGGGGGTWMLLTICGSVCASQCLVPAKLSLPAAESTNSRFVPPCVLLSAYLGSEVRRVRLVRKEGRDVSS